LSYSFLFFKNHKFRQLFFCFLKIIIFSLTHVTVNTRSIFHVKLRFFYGICHIKGLQIPYKKTLVWHGKFTEYLRYVYKKNETFKPVRLCFFFLNFVLYNRFNLVMKQKTRATFFLCQQLIYLSNREEQIIFSFLL
jgi:hypothetical protein